MLSISALDYPVLHSNYLSSKLVGELHGIQPAGPRYATVVRLRIMISGMNILFRVNRRTKWLEINSRTKLVTISEGGSG